MAAVVQVSGKCGRLSQRLADFCCAVHYNNSHTYYEALMKSLNPICTPLTHSIDRRIFNVWAKLAESMSLLTVLHELIVNVSFFCMSWCISIAGSMITVDVIDWTLVLVTLHKYGPALYSVEVRTVRVRNRVRFCVSVDTGSLWVCAICKMRCAVWLGLGFGFGLYCRSG